MRPPGNRLERLKGDRSGQYSIRINEAYSGKVIQRAVLKTIGHESGSDSLFECMQGRR